MRPEELSSLLRKQPFVPLRIHMTDGRTYDIRRPEGVLVLRERADIGIKPDPATGVVETVEHCSLLHIARVEELPPAAPQSDGPGASSGTG